MDSAVRWPKSASKIAARARRRPVRRPRTRSAPDAIDDDRDRPHFEPEQSLDDGRHCGADLGGQRHEGLTRPGDDPQADDDMVLADAHGHGATAKVAPPRGP